MILKSPQLGAPLRRRRHHTNFAGLDQAAEAAGVAAAVDDDVEPQPHTNWHPVMLGVTTGLLVWGITRVLDRVWPR